MSPRTASLALALASATSTGCGARTGLDAAEVADRGTCGDGVLDPGEQCEAGGVTHRIVLVQGDTRREIVPVATSISLQAFYAYSSKSAHTGFEQVRRSKLFLHLEEPSGELSLVSLHGIDIDATGIVQPVSRVQQVFSGLPASCFVSIADDGDHEFFLDEDLDDTAIGDWAFEMNTDGGALGGLPHPASWSIDVTAQLIEGVDGWDFVDGDSSLVALDPDETATLTAFFDETPCRPDCTRQDP